MFFPIFSRFSLNLLKFNSHLVYSAHEVGRNVLSLVICIIHPAFDVAILSQK